MLKKLMIIIDFKLNISVSNKLKVDIKVMSLKSQKKYFKAFRDIKISIKTFINKNITI